MSRLLRGILDVLLGSVVLLTIVRIAGLDRGFPLVTVMTVFPYVVGVGALVGFVSLMRSWRTEAWICFAVVLAGVALLAPRALPGPAPAAEPDGPALSVAIANLRFGMGDAATVTSAVRRRDVDVLVVTELTEAAIDRLDDAGLDVVLPHRTLLPSRLTSGAGIYSRHRVEAGQPSTQRRFGPGTPKATIMLGAGYQVQLDAVHPLPPVSRSWTDAWREALASLPPPAEDRAGAVPRVLAGDFNATQDHRAFRELLSRGWVDAADATGTGLRPTFSSLRYGEPVPPVTLDHVLVDGRTAVREVEVTRLPGSDHHILVVELTLPAD